MATRVEGPEVLSRRGSFHRIDAFVSPSLPPLHYDLGPSGFYHPSRRRLLLRNRRRGPTPHARVLAFLRDRVHPGIPRAYYRAVLGHDLHASMHAELYARQFHAGAGWWEDLGLVSREKVTTAFVAFEALNLVTDSTTYGDFKWHDVGTDGTAEHQAIIALVVPTGIPRVSGTQVNPSANVYQTVATITADTTETWREHGVFNSSAVGTLMDRSLISPVVSVIAGDSVEFTYQLVKTAEA